VNASSRKQELKPIITKYQGDLCSKYFESKYKMNS